MTTTIRRVLGACIVITQLAILVGASLPSVAEASTAAASGGASELYLAPESVCGGDDDPALPNPDQEAGMACLLDYARAAAGLRALHRSPLLARSAAIKVADIVRCEDFSHTACGQSVNAPFELAHYIALRFSVELSENLACGTAGDTPRSIMRAWLDSAGHRRNLLNARWLDGGLALGTLPEAGGPAGRAIWVAHFGRREAVAAEFSAPLSVLTTGPPPAGAALRPSVRPARAASGRMTSFRFLVTSMAKGTRRAVAGASVFFATQRASTNAQGRASIAVRLRRPGRYRAITMSAGRQATVSVQIVGAERTAHR